MLENRDFKEQIKMELFDQLNLQRGRANLPLLHYDYFLESNMIRYFELNDINGTFNKHEFIQSIGVHPYTNEMEFDVLTFKQDIEHFSDKLSEFIQKNSLSIFNQHFNVLAIELLTDSSVINHTIITMVIVILNSPLYLKEIGTDIDNIKIYGNCLKEESLINYIQIENYDTSGNFSVDNISEAKMIINKEYMSFNISDNSFYAKIPKFLLKENSINCEVIKLGFYVKKRNEPYSGNKYGFNINDKLIGSKKGYLVFEIIFDLKSKSLENRYSFGLEYLHEIGNCRFFLNTPHKGKKDNFRKSRSAQKPMYKTAHKVINKLELSNHALQKSAKLEFKQERSKKLYYFCERSKTNSLIYVSRLKTMNNFRKILDNKYLEHMEEDLKNIFENKNVTDYFGNTIAHLKSVDSNLFKNESQHSAFKNYYQSNELSDLIFEDINKKERKSHKLVMLSASPFFSKLLKYSQGTYSYKNIFDFNKTSDKEFKEMQTENFQIGYKVDKIIIPQWLPLSVFDNYLKFCYHNTLDINSIQKIEDFISLLRFALITSTSEFMKMLILNFLQQFDIFSLDKSYILILLKFLLNENLDISSAVNYYVVIVFGCLIRLLQLPKDFLVDNQTLMLSFKYQYIEDMLVIDYLLRRDEIYELLLKILLTKQQNQSFRDFVIKSRPIEKLNNTIILNNDRFKMETLIQKLHENNDQKSYIEIDLIEFGIQIAIEEDANRLLCHASDNQIKTALLETTIIDDDVIKISINNMKKGSLIVGNSIEIHNIKLHPVFYIDQMNNLSIFFLKYKVTSSDNDMFFSIDIRISNMNKDINQYISMIARLSHSYLVGVETNVNIAEKGLLEIEIIFRESCLYPILINYIAMNFDNVEFITQAKNTLKHIDFAIEPIKLESDDILGLNYMDLFYIFKNRNLYLRDEKTLLIFVVLYIEKQKDKLSRKALETLLLAIKFEYIDFELLLKLIRDNKTLADVEAFRSVLIRKLRNQEQLSSPRKFYKIKRKDCTFDLYERLIDWILNEDHHESCNFIIKEQAETIDDLKANCDFYERKLNNNTKELNSYKKKCEIFEHSARKKAKPLNTDQSMITPKSIIDKFCQIF